LQGYLHLLGIKEITHIEKHGYTIPLSPRKEPLAKGPVFLTGDAAGLADPITAEGISHAIRSGRLAAQAILTQSSISDSAECYQDLVESEILRELKAARILATVLYRWPTLRNFSFRLSGQKLCEFMTDVVTGEKSYGEAIRRPSSYVNAFS
jgi:flavin-dependent dehydrogenase